MVLFTVITCRHYSVNTDTGEKKNGVIKKKESKESKITVQPDSGRRTEACVPTKALGENTPKDISSSRKRDAYNRWSAERCRNCEEDHARCSIEFLGEYDGSACAPLFAWETVVTKDGRAEYLLDVAIKDCSENMGQAVMDAKVLATICDPKTLCPQSSPYDMVIEYNVSVIRGDTSRLSSITRLGVTEWYDKPYITGKGTLKVLGEKNGPKTLDLMSLPKFSWGTVGYELECPKQFQDKTSCSGNDVNIYWAKDKKGAYLSRIEFIPSE